MGNGMRVLKVLTVVMGVMILAGTAVVVAVIIRRASAPTASAPVASALVALVLDEPSGTHMAGIAATQDRIAVELQGGGPDRLVFVDPRSGTVTGRIALAR